MGCLGSGGGVPSAFLDLGNIFSVLAVPSRRTCRFKVYGGGVRVTVFCRVVRWISVRVYRCMPLVTSSWVALKIRVPFGESFL